MCTVVKSFSQRRRRFHREVRNAGAALRGQHDVARNHIVADHELVADGVIRALRHRLQTERSGISMWKSYRQSRPVDEKKMLEGICDCEGSGHPVSLSRRTEQKAAPVFFPKHSQNSSKRAARVETRGLQHCKRLFSRFPLVAWVGAFVSQGCRSRIRTKFHRIP